MTCPSARDAAVIPHALARALQTLERSIGHDYLVVLISDFYGWDEQTLKIIRSISQHNDIICSLVFDPLERDISSASKLVVSDGRYQLEIDPRARAWEKNSKPVSKAPWPTCRTN